MLVAQKELWVNGGEVTAGLVTTIKLKIWRAHAFGFIAKDYTETPLTQDGGYMAYLHETRANISGAEVQLG